ncbi:hypothetical protein QVA66_04820 [Staphylococcus chromogenes]|nr:hypothetical protein [Staphylococcus chromogenes]
MTPLKNRLPRRLSIAQDWWWAIGIFLSVSLLRLSIVSALAEDRGKSLDDVLMRWDSVHYVAIARGGYFEMGAGIPPNEYETRLAFFPLFPFSMRVVHSLTGLSYLQAGMLVNFLAGIAMVAAVMFLAAHLEAPLWSRIAAGVMVAGAPMGLTYNMPYTEAMFAAFAYWALWAMLQRRWFLAGTLVFFTCLTRITGVDLLIVFLLVVLAWGRKNWRAWVALFAAPLGMVTYLWFVNSHTQHIGGYFGLQQKGWNSKFDFGASSVKFLSWCFNASSDSWVVACGFFMIWAAACILMTVRSLPWPVWLFSSGIAANVLLADGVVTSRPRLLLPAVICMVPLAILVTRREASTSSGSWREAADDMAFWLRWAVLTVGWILLGALISVHPLLATKWAI